MKLQKIGKKKIDRQKDEADLSPSRLSFANQLAHRLP